jgi:LPS-assembly protein
MKRLRKFRPNYSFTAILAASFLFTLTWKSFSQPHQPEDFYRALTSWQDTIPAGTKDSVIITPVDSSLLSGNDTLLTRLTTDTFSLKLSKDTLDAPVRYEAEDSAVILVKEKKIILYGKTKTQYQDITLTAPIVELDQQKQMLTAMNTKDSAGNVLEMAHFQQGEDAFTSDTIFYNFKTQKGLTKNTVTRQGEFFVHGKDIKKVSSDVTYVRQAVFSTCNLDEPHFAFRTNKMKVVTGKLAVSGPAHPEFEGVPVPIYIPFGLYPLSRGRRTGLLPPQYSNNEEYGLGLEGLGYYKVLSDYWDAKLYGNVYSYGGWSVNINPSYRKRYRYNGAFNFSMQSTKLNFKGDPDFSKTKTFFITWGHTVDSRARPGTNFSANVNAGSTKFNRFIPNDPNQNFQNQLGSSVSYSKTWKDKPYNLTMSANHSQNNATRLVNLSLPNVGFTVNTVYPFQKKDFVGSQKWYEKFGIGYNGNFRNQVSFYDTAFNFRDIIDTLQWGAQHNLPMNVSLPPILGGAVIVTPSVSYSQIWIAQKFRRSWNDAAKKVDTTITKGFFTDHTAQFSLSLNTAVFGTLNFKKSRVSALRHVIRPAMSINYKPDLSKIHFYETQVDTTGYRIRFSEYQGSLYGFYPEGKFGGMSFQVDNNIEMKVRSKSDTAAEAMKKIRLVDGFGFSTAYNFFADSLKLSLINLYFRTSLFEKISITANGTLNPYQSDDRGRNINKYAWQDGKFSLGRITNAGVSMSASFQSKPKDAKKEEERKRIMQQQQQSGDAEFVADQQRLLDYMRKNPSEFVDFNIPWQVSLSLSVNYFERLKPDYSGFEKDFSSNLNFNGSFNLTPKWNFTTNGYFDFDTRTLQTFQLGINRDMHCWQLAINVTPIGLYRFFNITISPKSSILQDLRINRMKYFTNFN